MARTFTCERCGGTFESAGSIGEAWDEARARFPEIRDAFTAANYAEYCDDCDAAFMVWFATLSDEDKARMQAEHKTGKTEG